ncbi:MAG: RES family NAD+ phosphorylase [Burkholderiales bacterium]|nr:RES family NAD+ phosphorylase [Burkholderiales bacterium]
MSVVVAAPVLLWRIGVDTPGYQAHDLSGKGAEVSGGRWNRPGTPLVYTSTTRALACLETVVHLGAGSLPLNRYLVAIELPQALWDAAAVLDPSALVGWDAEPAGQASLAWGEAWARDNRSLLARVPSVIVPEEHNVLINPRHPDAGQLQAIKQRRWLYDARLLR